MIARLPRSLRLGLALCVATASVASAASLKLEVSAGDSDRIQTPVHVTLPAAKFSDAILQQLQKGDQSKYKAGPVALKVAGAAKSAQLDRGEKDGEVVLTFVLDKLDANMKAEITVDTETADSIKRPWEIWERERGIYELRNRERTVFKYNATPISHPNYGPIQRRDAYIHPAFTPSGHLITGDYSKNHPHHRGFFLAYTHTQIGDLHPDFWNIHTNTGKIFAEEFGNSAAGPVSASFSTKHRWEAKGKVVMRETWEVEAYDIPGRPYWLFDITATQRAENEPVELQPYRYGGMAYRGAEPFLNGGIDLLTDLGSGRAERDQKPARWVDLTGPIAEGANEFGGAMIADHPQNVNHPTVARIHPTLLPFFSYVPSYTTPVVIRKDKPTVFKYRVMIHDGHPDKALDERIFRDFANPPTVTIVGSD